MEKISSEARRLRLVEIVRTLEESLFMEVDLRLEGAAQSEIIENTENDDFIRVPKIYWELTSKNILATEWVDSFSSKDIENGAQELNPVRLLVNTPGVQIQQHSLNSINVEMRAGSGLFGTSTFPILDYRYLATPAADSFFSYSTGISNIDIAKIEVVRGANSAMYGPSVTSGVVHFLTKSAIDSPGSTLELTGGSMDTRGINFRHARSNESKTFGYKINVKYNEGADFGLDPVEDAERISSFYTKIVQPIIKNKVVDATQSGSPLIGMDYLDPDGDGNPLASEYQNLAMNAHFEFRPNENTTATLSGGYSDAGGLAIQDQGYFFNQGIAQNADSDQGIIFPTRE